MLVVSRQRDQTIVIGDDIEITIVDIRGDRARIGISAPSDVSVHRKEVWLQIKKEQEIKDSIKRENRTITNRKDEDTK